MPPKATCPESLMENPSKKPKETPSGRVSPLVMILVIVPADQIKRPCRPSVKTALNTTCFELFRSPPSMKLMIEPSGIRSPGPAIRVSVLLESRYVAAAKKEPESVINMSPLRANLAPPGITSSPVLACIPFGMNCVMLPLAYRYAAEALGKVAPAEKATCPCGPTDGSVKETNTPPPGAVSPGPATGMTL